MDGYLIEKKDNYTINVHSADADIMIVGIRYKTNKPTGNVTNVLYDCTKIAKSVAHKHIGTDIYSRAEPIVVVNYGWSRGNSNSILTELYFKLSKSLNRNEKIKRVKENGSLEKQMSYEIIVKYDEYFQKLTLPLESQE